MNANEFIPKEFHEVVFDVNEGSENICTPYYPDFLINMPANQLVINVPQQIIYKPRAGSLIIPMCGAYVISDKRKLKYAHLSNLTIHVRKIEEKEEEEGEEEIWFWGNIVDLNDKYGQPFMPSEEEENERQQKIKRAQEYSDEEIDALTGQFEGKAINVNIMDFMNMKVTQGIYEIFLSFAGLESNRVQVEIIFKI